MKPYQHILLAQSFSVQDAEVAEKAQSIAKQYQAKLTLVHVLDNIPMPDTAYGAVIRLDQKSGDPLLEQEKARLLQTAESLRIEPSNCWLIWGVPENEIAELAKQQQADLIVVGFHARQGLSWLFGSTANGVLQHAQCDVLAIRLTEK
jgi:universal stress protein A